MKKKASFAGIVLFIFFVFSFCGKQDHFSVLKGPYLGQTPPGTEPEIFAPGLITTHYSQSYISFLNEAQVCVYSAGTEKGHETYYTYEKNGHWTTPQRAPFEELQGHPNYTTGPRGRKVYFHSGRPTHPEDTRQDDNIWTIEWTSSGWAEPEALPSPANSDYGEAYPSATTDGTVYFFTWKRDDTRGDDIWVSRCIDGQYQEAERLPWPINTDFIEYDPYVAPDESCLIFGSNRPGGYGNSDNYICFRNEDGSWTPPINLGRPLNSSSWDLCANGTPDGKYFFFLSGRKTDVDKGHIGKKSGEEPVEDSDLYWVDFSFINDLKNTVLTKQNSADIIKQDYEKYGIQSAIDTLNKLYSNQKDDTYFSPFELLSLCKNMIAEDKTGEADFFFSALDEVLPKDLSIKEGYARFCAMNGHVSKGLNILEELESEDPNYDLNDSLSSLGYLFTLYPDKTEDALSVLQFTVEKFPEDPFAYYSLARVYRQLGDLDNAIGNCRKALEIRPSVGDVSQLLERLLKEKEETKESFPFFKGHYLGQKPPGMTPEIFTPGVVSTSLDEFGCTMSPDGREFYFTRTYVEPRRHTIMVCQFEANGWTAPEIAPFSGQHSEAEPNFSPDGSRLFFGRPESGIWMVERSRNGWYASRYLLLGMFATASNNGTLYYTNVSRGMDKCDIVKSRYVNGQYMEQEALKGSLNSPFKDAHPYVAPDESYIIFDSIRPGGMGGNDLYISFGNMNGLWGEAINLGEKINSPEHEAIPFVSPEGKFLFYSTKGDIYWVSTKILEDLKPKELK